MASSIIGELSVEISVDAQGVKDGIKASGKALKLGGKQLRDSANQWGKWALAATAAAAGVAAAILKSNLASIRELKNLAGAANTQVAAFQRGAFAAEQFGISTEKYGDILKDVTERVGDFVTEGAGPMARFFETIAPKIGITADAFKGLSGQDALQLYIKSIQDANVSQQEMTVLMEDIASDSTRLFPLFQNNAKAFNALTQEAKDLGIGLSNIDVAKAELASSELAKAGGIIEALTQQATVELAPIIAKVTELFVDMAKEAGGASKFIKDGIKGVVSVVGVFADGLRGIEIIFKGLEVAALGFTSAVTVATAELAETVESMGDKFQEIGKTQGAIGGQFRALGFIFGKTKEQADGLTQSAAEMAREIANSQIEQLQIKLKALSDLALEPLPSIEIAKFVDEAIAEYESLAEAKAKALGGQDLEGDGVGTKRTSELELFEAETIGLLEALGIRFQSQEEMELAHLQREQDMINTSFANGELTSIEHSEKLAEIKQQEEDIKRNITLQGIQQGFQALAANSKKVEKAMKAAAIVQAIIKGKQAAVDAWQAGMSVGGPFAPVVAAAYTAASIIRTGSMIKAIRGGGSSTGGGGGGGAGAGVGQPQQQQQQQQAPQEITRNFNVNFANEGFLSTQQVRQLMGQIDEQAGDNVNINTTVGA